MPTIQQKFLLTFYAEGRHFALPFYAETTEEAIDIAESIVKLTDNPEIESHAEVDGEWDGHIATISDGRTFVRSKKPIKIKVIR